jgi:hypothetical protein
MLMKILLSLVLVVTLACTAAPPIYAEPREVVQGTEIHLTLLDSINSKNTREGDPFVAVVSAPVVVGSLIIIPAGTKVHGVVGAIQQAKSFSLFRGQAYMNISFKTMEVDSRLIPIQMSILGIGGPRGVEGYSKRRNDMKITEGEILQEKHDVKGDVIGMAVGGGGGSLVGLIFSNVARGFGIGMAGGAIYVVARKGKEIDMPAQTGMLVRMDSTITVPLIAASAQMSGTVAQ